MQTDNEFSMDDLGIGKPDVTDVQKADTQKVMEPSGGDGNGFSMDDLGLPVAKESPAPQPEENPKAPSVDATPVKEPDTYENRMKMQREATAKLNFIGKVMPDAPIGGYSQKEVLDSLQSYGYIKIPKEQLDEGMAAIDSAYTAAIHKQGFLDRTWGSVKRGMAQNYTMLKQAGYAVTGANSEEDKENLKGMKQDLDLYSIENPKKVGSLKDVKSVGDALNIAWDSVLENLPIMAVETVASAGMGLAAHAVGMGAKGVAWATMAGAGLSTMAQNTGEAVGDQVEEGLDLNRGLALLQGAGYSVLDMCGGAEVRSAKRLVKGITEEPLKEVKRGLITNAGKALREIGKDALWEGWTEAAQSGVVGRGRRWLQTGTPYAKGETLKDALWMAADEAYGGAMAAIGLGTYSTGRAYVSDSIEARRAGVTLNNLFADKNAAGMKGEDKVMLVRYLMGKEAEAKYRDLLEGETDDKRKKFYQEQIDTIGAVKGKTYDVLPKDGRRLMDVYDGMFADGMTLENTPDKYKPNFDAAGMMKTRNEHKDAAGNPTGAVDFYDKASGIRIVSDKDSNFQVVNANGIKMPSDSDNLFLAADYGGDANKCADAAFAYAGKLSRYNQWRADVMKKKGEFINAFMKGEKFDGNVTVFDSLAGVDSDAAKAALVANGNHAVMVGDTVYCMADMMKTPDTAKKEVLDAIAGKSVGAEEDAAAKAARDEFEKEMESVPDTEEGKAENENVGAEGGQDGGKPAAGGENAGRAAAGPEVQGVAGKSEGAASGAGQAVQAVTGRKGEYGVAPLGEVDFSDSDNQKMIEGQAQNVRGELWFMRSRKTNAEDIKKLDEATRVVQQAMDDVMFSSDAEPFKKLAKISEYYLNAGVGSRLTAEQRKNLLQKPTNQTAREGMPKEEQGGEKQEKVEPSKNEEQSGKAEPPQNAPKATSTASEGKKEQTPAPAKETQPAKQGQAPAEPDKEAIGNDYRKLITGKKTFQQLLEEDFPVERIPIKGIIINSPELRQFKKESVDKATGETEEGRIEHFSYASAGAILVYEKADGTRIVASGRHRINAAIRAGKTGIDARLIKEKDGYTLHQAHIMDALDNIHDEKGTINDYYQFLTEIGTDGLTEGELANIKSSKTGGAAWRIFKSAGKALLDLTNKGTREERYKAEQLVTYEQAAAIAKAAPVDVDKDNAAIQVSIAQDIINGRNGLRSSSSAEKVEAVTRQFVLLARQELEKEKDKGGGNGGYENPFDLLLNGTEESTKKVEAAKKRSVENAQYIENLRSKFSSIKSKLATWSNNRDVFSGFTQKFLARIGLTKNSSEAQIKKSHDVAKAIQHYIENASSTGMGLDELTEIARREAGVDYDDGKIAPDNFLDKMLRSARGEKESSKKQNSAPSVKVPAPVPSKERASLPKAPSGEGLTRESLDAWKKEAVKAVDAVKDEKERAVLNAEYVKALSEAEKELKGREPKKTEKPSDGTKGTDKEKSDFIERDAEVKKARKRIADDDLKVKKFEEAIRKAEGMKLKLPDKNGKEYSGLEKSEAELRKFIDAANADKADAEKVLPGLLAKAEEKWNAFKKSIPAESLGKVVVEGTLVRSGSFLHPWVVDKKVSDSVKVAVGYRYDPSNLDKALYAGLKYAVESRTPALVYFADLKGGSAFVVSKPVSVSPSLANSAGSYMVMQDGRVYRLLNEQKKTTSLSLNSEKKNENTSIQNGNPDNDILVKINESLAKLSEMEKWLKEISLYGETEEMKKDRIRKGIERAKSLPEEVIQKYNYLKQKISDASKKAKEMEKSLDEQKRNIYEHYNGNPSIPIDEDEHVRLYNEWVLVDSEIRRTEREVKKLIKDYPDAKYIDSENGADSNTTSALTLDGGTKAEIEAEKKKAAEKKALADKQNAPIKDDGKTALEADQSQMDLGPGANPTDLLGAANVQKNKTEVKRPGENLTEAEKKRKDELIAKLRSIAGRASLLGADRVEALPYLFELGGIYVKGGARTFRQFAQRFYEEAKDLYTIFRNDLRNAFNSQADADVTKAEAEKTLAEIESGKAEGEETGSTEKTEKTESAPASPLDALRAGLARSGIEVRINKDTGNVELGGKTYPAKDGIKRAGGRWDRANGVWYFTGDAESNIRKLSAAFGVDLGASLEDNNGTKGKENGNEEVGGRDLGPERSEEGDGGDNALEPDFLGEAGKGKVQEGEAGGEVGGGAVGESSESSTGRGGAVSDVPGNRGQVPAGAVRRGDGREGVPGAPVPGNGGGGKPGEVKPVGVPENMGVGPGGRGLGGDAAGGPVRAAPVLRRRFSGDAVLVRRFGGSPVEYLYHEHEANPSDKDFTPYRPGQISIEGVSSEHASPLVESTSMSGVAMPVPTYVPILNADTVGKRILTVPQLEAVIYAGQAHSQTMPDGRRKGFLIGDGTGVGKGREISGVILDNYRHGRKKAVWISVSSELVNDARRDLKDVGVPADVIDISGTGWKDLEGKGEGVAFVIYNSLVDRKGKKNERYEALLKWLGKDFDGVVAMDEAHKVGNLIRANGGKPISKTAVRAKEFQDAVPNARLLYASATGASEIKNLAFADRLGIWGNGCAFPSAENFIDRMNDGGVSSLEIAARDMKRLGVYISRTLSYDGVETRRLEYKTTAEQKKLYNDSCRFLGAIYQAAHRVFSERGYDTGENREIGKTFQGTFVGAAQRFYNQLLSGFMADANIADMEESLKSGKSVVVQLFNTGAAEEERKLANGEGDEVSSPADVVINFLNNNFPTDLWKASEDPVTGKRTWMREQVERRGKLVYEKVNGVERPVYEKDPELIRLRDGIIAKFRKEFGVADPKATYEEKKAVKARMPESPLDHIVRHFQKLGIGVAEVTGRSVRVNADGKMETGRSGETCAKEAEEFNAGRRRVLVFTSAGGTGFSFHADKRFLNKQQRVHYALQLAWRADQVLQGLGRTHRANEAMPPVWVLCGTDIPGNARFLSSVARRISQMGAITKGDRKGAESGLFSEGDNLETEYAKSAIADLLVDVRNGSVDGVSLKDLAEWMNMDEDKLVDVYQHPTRFMNGMLMLPTDLQDRMFNLFHKKMAMFIGFAKESGRYDEGLQKLRALSMKETGDETIATDESSGAETHLKTYDVEYPTNAVTFSRALEIIGKGNESAYGTGKFFIDTRGVIHGVKRSYRRQAGSVNSIPGYYVFTTSMNSDLVHYWEGEDFGKKTKGWRDLSDIMSIENADAGNPSIVKNSDVMERAEKMWKAQESRQGKSFMSKGNRFIEGALLPIWKFLPRQKSIFHYSPDGSRYVIGDRVYRDDEKRVLSALHSLVAGKSAEKTLEAMKDGRSVPLSNGWSVQKRDPSKPDRVYVYGVTDSSEKEFADYFNGETEIDDNAGHWKISFSHFIDVGTESGRNGFERLIKSNPAILGKSEKAAYSLGENAGGAGTESASAIEAAARAMGAPLSWGDPSKMQGINGYFKDGKIVVNPRISDADKARFVFGHELFHFLDREGFGEEFKSFISRNVPREEVIRRMQELNRRLEAMGLPRITEQEALQEIAADIAGERMKDERFFRLIQAQRPSLWDKIVAWARDFLNRFLGGVPEECRRYFGKDSRAFAKALSLAGDAMAEFKARDGEAARRSFIGDFSRTDNNIYRSILGETGASQLRDAEKVIENLGVAKGMTAEKPWQDMTREERLKVKAATGWEMGSDGKWRYEIPDGFIPKNVNEILKKHGSEYRKYTFRSFDPKGEFLTSVELKYIMGPFLDEFGELSEVKDSLGSIDVVFATSNDSGGTMAFTNPYRKIIVVYLDGMKSWKFDRENGLQWKNFITGGFSEIGERTIRGMIGKVLVHEIQHNIQKLEGMPSGKANSEDTSYDEYYRSYTEVEARNAEQRSLMGRYDKRNTLLSDTEDVADGDKIYWQQRDDAYGKLSLWSNGVTPEQDAQYMEAVKRGDMEAAQKMVDEAAEKCKYDTLVYHGTSSSNEGIKVFNTYNHGGMYASTLQDVSKTYGDKIYRLYVKSGDYLHVDAKGRSWGAIDRGSVPSEILSGRSYYEGKNTLTADDVAILARANGYKGVVIENVFDGGEKAGTDVISFHSNLVKSADPVTRDDAGNVIPLSQRFNETRKDIRYSPWSNGVTPEQDAQYLDAAKRGDMDTIKKLFQTVLQDSWDLDRRGNNIVTSPNKIPFQPGKITIDMIGEDPYLYKDTWMDPRKFTYDDEGRSYSEIVNMPTTQKYIEWYKKGFFAEPATVVYTTKNHILKSGNRRRVVAAIEAGIDKIPVRLEIGKLSELAVTYDDAGNVIPLSQRFNETRKDIRYSPWSNGVTPEQDAQYMEAVKRGDMEAAQKMVIDLYRKAGYHVLMSGSFFKKTIPETVKGNAMEEIDTEKRFSPYAVRSMPDSFKDEVASWPFISVSPYSDSFYNMKGKTWNNTPDGIIRISDHWNFSSRGVEHCKTDVPVKNVQTWAMAKYDAKTGVWKVLKTEPSLGKFDPDFAGYGEMYGGRKHPLFRAMEEFQKASKEFEKNRTDETSDFEVPVVGFNGRNLKLLNAVTRDDAGNVIPLSQRFNDTVNDTRYSIGWRARETANRELLDEVDTALRGDSPSGVNRENRTVFSLDEAADSAIRQSITSADTSLNQVAAGLKSVPLKPGTVNFDLGGGEYDKGTEYLASRGVENVVYDPFNRNAESNRRAFDIVRGGGFDSVTCNNVLNVIKEPGVRDNVILQAAKALKKGGTAYFTVYEGGDRRGESAGETRSGWQNRMPTREYLPEIMKRFKTVNLSNGVISASDPIIDGKATWFMDSSQTDPVRYSLDESGAEKKGNPAQDGDYFPMRFTKAHIDALREKMGRDEVFVKSPYHMRAKFMEAVDRIVVDPEYGNRMVEKFAQAPNAAATVDEFAALEAMSFMNKSAIDEAEARAREMAKSGDVEKESEADELLRNQEDGLYVRMDRIDEALKRAASSAGATLNMVKLALDRDMNEVRQKEILERIKGSSLTVQEEQHLYGLIAKLKAENAALEKAQAQAEENYSEQAAESGLGAIRLEAEKEERKTGGKKMDPAKAGERAKAALKRLAEKNAGFVEFATVKQFVRYMARVHIAEGMRQLDEVVKACVNDVAGIIPEKAGTYDERTVRDMFSGYGEVSLPSADELDKVHADLHQQALLVSQIEDVQSGTPPKKTGPQRNPPSDKARELTRVRNEVMKRLGIRTVDRETQLRSTQERIRTHLKNRISDLNNAIATGKKIIGDTHDPVVYDTENASLKEQLDKLQSAYDELFPKEPISDEEFTKRLLARKERQLEAWNKRLERARKGDFSNGKKEPRKVQSKAVDDAENRIEAVKNEIDDLKDLSEPKLTEEEIAIRKYRRYLDASMRRNQKTIDELNAGTWKPREKKDFTSLIFKDPELYRRWKNAERVRDELKRMKEVYRLKNQSAVKRGLSLFAWPWRFARSWMSSFDYSAMFRQGGKAVFADPVEGLRAFMPMLRAGWSEKSMEEIHNEIFNRENAQFYKKAGLYIAPFMDTGSLSEIESLAAQREEAFAGKLSDLLSPERMRKFEAWTGKKYNPVGLAFRAKAGSERAYITFLNVLRANLFDKLTEEAGGVRNMGDKELRAIGKFINLATGRGEYFDSKRMSDASELLSGIFFAPRWMVSNFEWLAGTPLWSGSKVTRRIITRQYAKSMVNTIATMAVAAVLFNLLRSDDDPEDLSDRIKDALNPLSSKFLKAKLGTDSYVDFGSGVLQNIVMASRLITGKTADSQGRVYPKKRDETLGRFARGKLSPLAGMGIDLLTGKDFNYEDVTFGSEMKGNLIPLSAGEIIGNWKSLNLPESAVESILTTLGVSVGAWQDDDYRWLAKKHASIKAMWEDGDAEKRKDILRRYPYFRNSGAVDLLNHKINHLKSEAAKYEKLHMDNPALQKQIAYLEQETSKIMLTKK